VASWEWGEEGAIFPLNFLVVGNFYLLRNFSSKSTKIRAENKIPHFGEFERKNELSTHVSPMLEICSSLLEI